MPGSSHRSGRVVIMDDVSWSEPTPRKRRILEAEPPSRATRLDPGSVRGDDPLVGRPGDRDWARESVRERPRTNDRDRDRTSAGDRAWAPSRGVTVDIDFDAMDSLERSWRSAPADEPELIELEALPEELDDERIWGPRPRLQADEPGGRRTVVITGHVADRQLAPRTRSTALDRGRGLQADRTAMWAVLLCVILLLVAVTSH